VRSITTLAAGSSSSPTPSASRRKSYDLRSNAGGIAVSGEVTMHADHVYVQACQPATGHDTGLMFRTCQDRKDYHGGPNHFASLDLLNRPNDLARRIREACRV
jgi:hypothetical protein